MTTAEVLDHLRGAGLLVLQGRRGAQAQCPAHDDSRPSLHLTTGREGRTLIVCRAGCRTEDVLAAAGLRLSDLFTGSAPATSRPRTPIEWFRSEAAARAGRQGWMRHRERYAAADAIRTAGHVQQTAHEDGAEVWERLAEAAALTTAAENVLADLL